MFVLFPEQPSASIDPPSKNYQARDTVSITCQVNGFPAPAILWYKDGIQLESDERISLDGSSLVIGYAQLLDAGEYKCAVWNIAGQSRATVKLQYTGEQNAIMSIFKLVITCLIMNSTY